MSAGERGSRWIRVAFAGRSRKPSGGRVGADQAQHEQWVGPGPLHQIGDELEQRGVRPLHVLERHQHRALLGQALEKQTPGCEEILLVGSGALLQADQVGQAGKDESPVLRIGTRTDPPWPEAWPGRVAVLCLEDPGPAPHHLGQGEVGHPLP